MATTPKPQSTVLLVLRQLARPTGGRLVSDPGEAFAHTFRSVGAPRPLWPALLVVVALLVVADVGVRRVRISAPEFRAGYHALRRRLGYVDDEPGSARRELLSLGRRREANGPQLVNLVAVSELLPVRANATIHRGAPTSRSGRLLAAKRRGGAALNSTMGTRQRVFRRAGALFAFLWLICSLAAPVAAAHPLGNFTVNHYSRVEVSGDTLAVRYVLDMAEIPSVQETRAADADGDGTVSRAEWDAYKERKAVEITQQIEMSIDNQRITLQPTDLLISQPLGQGDIPLVRLEMWLRPSVPIAPAVQHQAAFRDRSDPARVGWREVVVHSGPGATLIDSDVPSQDATNELRSYPDDLLQNPLDQREAHWSFSMDGRVASANALPVASPVSRPSDPLAALVTATDLSPAVIMLALVGAAALGGIHAASPGHGKSIMAAYIVGTRGTVWHASALAVSVTFAHTTGVLLLGILTVLASNLIVPDRLYPWLTLVSGVVVLVVGARFLAAAVRRRMSHGHGDGHGHQHGPPHEGAHAPVINFDGWLGPTWRGLFALGLAGGIVPSGSALVVLLSSVALGRLGFGLVLIVAFGFGMAMVLVATGVLLVHAGHFMVRLFPAASRDRLSALVPLVSASVMTLLGVVTTFEGLLQTRIFGP